MKDEWLRFFDGGAHQLVGDGVQGMRYYISNAKCLPIL